MRREVPPVTEIVACTRPPLPPLLPPLAPDASTVIDETPVGTTHVVLLVQVVAEDVTDETSKLVFANRVVGVSESPILNVAEVALKLPAYFTSDGAVAVIPAAKVWVSVVKAPI